MVEPPTPLKNDGVSSSVGMMTFPTEWNIKKIMFQTTNQKYVEHPVGKEGELKYSTRMCFENHPTEYVIFQRCLVVGIW